MENFQPQEDLVDPPVLPSETIHFCKLGYWLKIHVMNVFFLYLWQYLKKNIKRYYVYFYWNQSPSQYQKPLIFWHLLPYELIIYCLFYWMFRHSLCHIDGIETVVVGNIFSIPLAVTYQVILIALSMLVLPNAVAGIDISFYLSPAKWATTIVLLHTQTY